MVRIEEWRVTSRGGDAYTPPECQLRVLAGKVYGHPRFPNGHYIWTSEIREVDGPKVTTQSGTVYHLGEPDTGFIEWCKANNVYVPTKEVPIKVR
jgi:hypothetical protein